MQKQIIPLVIYGAKMPSLDELPESLHILRTKNVQYFGANFNFEMKKLTQSICSLVPDDFILSHDEYGEMALLFSAAERRIYLEWLIAMYGQIALPIDPEGRFPLDRVYQPLQLRRDPTIAEKLQREHERRALLGEQSRGENDPRINAEDESTEKNERKQQQDADKREIEQSVEIAENGVDALQRSTSHRMVVLGGPGTGKTTLLRQMLSDAANVALVDTTAPIPIFVQLPEWGRIGGSLKLYIQQMLHDRDVIINKQPYKVAPEYAGMLWQQIEHGHGLLCLDSLDEVSASARLSIIRHINEQANQVGGNWVIGSRFNDYKGQQFDGAHFVEWELKPLDRESRRSLAYRLSPVIHSLIHKDIKSTFRPSTALDYVNALEQHPTVSAWAENPLLFSLAQYVYTKRLDLPISRSELYQEIIDAIVASRESDVDVRREIILLFADSALLLFERYGRVFTRTDLHHSIRQSMQRFGYQFTPDVVAQYVARLIRSGLLDSIAQETYGFRHQTLQEYLVGMALAHWQIEPGELLRERIEHLVEEKATRTRWAEPIRAMIGVLTHNDQKKGRDIAVRWLKLFSTRYETVQGDPGHLFILVAIRCLSESGDISIIGQSAQQVLRRWYEAFFEAAHMQRYHLMVRLQEATIGIGRLPYQVIKGLENDLSKLLVNENWQVRQTVALALEALINEEQCLSFLANGDSNMRETAVRALRALGKRLSEKGISALLTALADRDRYVRQLAVQILGVLGERISEKGISVLLMAATDPEWQTRQAAIQALGALREQIGEAGSTALLTAATDPEREVRLAAVQALGALGEQIEEAGISAIIAATADPDRQMRLAAVQALGALGEQIGEAGSTALLTATTDPKREVRLAAVQALGVLGVRTSEAGISVLLMTATDPDRQMRLAAIQALGALGERISDAGISAIIAATADPDRQMRLAAVQALRALGERISDAGISAIIAATADPDRQMRLAAVQALRALGERISGEGISAIIAAAADLDWQMRLAAIQAFEALGERIGEAGSTAIFAALSDSDRGLSRVIPNTLGTLEERKSEASVSALIAILTEHDWQMRQVAIQILREMGERIREADIFALIATLSDSKWAVKQAVIQALGALGEWISEAGISAIIAALSDSKWTVRLAAIQALGALGEWISEAGISAIIAALSDSKWTVRLAAIQALGALGEQISEAGLSAIIAALSDSKWAVRQAVIQVLGALGEQIGKVGSTAIIAATADHDWRVRKSAVQALGALGERISEAELSALIAALTDSKWTVNQAAAQVLGHLGAQIGEAGISALIAALNNGNGPVKQAAIQALGALGEQIDEAGISKLLTTIANSTLQVGQEIAQILGTLGERISEAELSALITALTDHDWQVRQTIVQALGALGERISEAELSTLIAALADHDWRVRKSAVQMLGSLGERSVKQASLLSLQP